MTDRLYDLLPTIHRLRDAQQGYPLQALLRVIGEQVDVVEDDIAALYADWFVETASPEALPLIGDLVGYRPLPAGLVPRRRDIADTIRHRRRKGTLSVLEELAGAIGGWPAVAVEEYRRLRWAQHLDHQHLDGGRTVDLRDAAVLGRLGGPFDPFARTIDVRRPGSRRTRGLSNIPSVAVFAWRLKPYSVTRFPAYCVETAGPQCFTFSVLGNDAPLFSAGPVPEPIGRRTLADDGSFAIWAPGWGEGPIPFAALIPADLSGWTYSPPKGRVAVDPVLGRFAFARGQAPKRGVRVSYHYALADDLGGGEYERHIPAPPDGATVFKVGHAQPFGRIEDALRAWRKAQPRDAVIELCESEVFVEPIAIELGRDQSLRLQAGRRARPVLRLLDWQGDAPDALTVGVQEGSRLTLDGLLITGRGVQINGPGEGEVCGAEIVVRHCTLVPGWGLECDCAPFRPLEPSLSLNGVRAAVRVERSIVGSIEVHADPEGGDPIPVRVTDSVVDATESGREAIGSGGGLAHAALTLLRCTVFGTVQARMVAFAEDCIFNDCVHVARRQAGCLSHCYVPPGCRTPRRYRCQPDLSGAPARVRPQFTTRRYGLPGYAQLASECAEEIRSGASDQSEMGVFHDLFEPQRAEGLRARLDDYTPAGMDVGLFFAT